MQNATTRLFKGSAIDLAFFDELTKLRAVAVQGEPPRTLPPVPRPVPYPEWRTQQAGASSTVSEWQATGQALSVARPMTPAPGSSVEPTNGKPRSIKTMLAPLTLTPPILVSRESRSESFKQQKHRQPEHKKNNDNQANRAPSSQDYELPSLPNDTTDQVGDLTEPTMATTLATTPSPRSSRQHGNQHSSEKNSPKSWVNQRSAAMPASLKALFKPSKSGHPPSPRHNTSPTSSSPRVRFGSIDRIGLEVSLVDPRFQAFVDDAAKAAFINPWNHDSSDVSDSHGNRKKNADRLRPTFIRDFENSTYYVLDKDGKQSRISDTDDFIRYFGLGDDDGLAEVVSNIASQNLGNFLKNVLFLRQDSEKKSHSILRLSDDTPVMPLAAVKASYVLSKQDDRTAVIDYCWESAVKHNGGKEIMVKTLDRESRNLKVTGDAWLRIEIRITVNTDFTLCIGSPIVQFSGWNVAD